MLLFAYYTLKVIICSAVLYGYYWFFLRNKIFHSYNRFYLLVTILLSLTLPLLKFNVWQKAGAPKTSVVQMLQVVSSSDEYMDEIIIQSHYNHISKETIAMWAFISICLVFAMIFIITIFKIYLLKKNNPKQSYEGISLVYTEDKRTPFSFLKNIFWNDEIDINSNNGKRILKHELAHVKEKHSHDKLFMNTLLIFFWCNPIFWLIRRELNMIHEFIADKKAVEDGDTTAFAAMILQATYPGHRFEIANNFFYSPIKRRLTMLTKNKTKVSYISRLLVLPLTVIVFAAFTLKAKTYISSSLPKNKTITVVIDAGHGGTDNGAVAADGTLEKDINLSLAKRILELNKSENIKILLIRDHDVFQTPKEKAETANKLGAELFISIHIDNASTPAGNKQSGVTTWVPKDEFKNAAASKLFASSITAAFTENYQLRVASNPQQLGKGITVLQETNCPAVLIEAGFISNEKDLAYLKSTDGQEQFARNILSAIVNFAASKDRSQTVVSPQTKTDNTDTTYSGSFYNAILNSTDINKFSPDELIIINGKEYSKTTLETKTIKCRFGKVYGKNNPEMLTKYGSKAADGVIILEGATIENYINKNRTFDVDSIELEVNLKKDKNNDGIFISGNDKATLQTLIDVCTDEKGGGSMLTSEKPERLINMSASEKDHPALYFVNAKPVESTKLKAIDINRIDHAMVLLSFEAMAKYGDKGKYGAIEFTLKKDPSLILGGIDDRYINIRKLKDIKDVKCSDPHFQIASSTVYFSGEGFPDVVVSTINEGSLKSVEKYMQKIVAGSMIVFDNVYISKKDGSDKKEIAGKAFGFYDKNINEVDTGGHSYDIFTKVEQEPEFPGGKEGWQAYLQKNINAAMPVEEGWKPGTYTIVVNFVVDKAGDVSAVSSDDHVNSKTWQQCINLIKNGPKWIPAKQNGKIVSAYRKQPITFVVSEN